MKKTVKQIKVNNSNNGKNCDKEKEWYLPRHHCTTQHLCLFALGLPAPAVIRKDRKTGWWGGGQRQTTVRKLHTSLEEAHHTHTPHPPPPPHETTNPPLWAPLTCRLNSHTSPGAFWGLCANYTGHFLNIGSCDFSGVVWFGGKGRWSVCRCAQVTSHTHNSVRVTPRSDERPGLRRLSFSGRPAVWHYTDFSPTADLMGKIFSTFLLSAEFSWQIQ